MNRRKRRTKQGRTEQGERLVSNDGMTREEQAALCDIMLKGVGIARTEEGEAIFSREKVYQTREELQTVFYEYVNYIEEQGRKGVFLMPDTEAFCAFAGISRRKLSEMRRNEQLYSVIDEILNSFALYKKNRGYAGSVPPIVLAMDMNNNHDYVSNTSQIKVEMPGKKDSLPGISDILESLPVQEGKKTDEN